MAGSTDVAGRLVDVCNGAGGQRTIIIPSHDLVVVRMGRYRGDRAGMKTLNLALAELIAAVRARE